jgi:hypothetical protein
LSKRIIRYLIEDENYFILIDPDYSQADQNIARIEKIALLRHIHINQEKSSESRMVRVQVTYLSEDMTKAEIEEIILFFENPQKCIQARTMLESNKKESYKRHSEQMLIFIHKCEQDVH